MNFSPQVAQEDIQSKFHENTHALDVGMSYAFPIFLHSLVLSLFAFFGDGRKLLTPFLFYIVGLGIGEYMMDKIFSDEIQKMLPKSQASKEIKVSWPMDSKTYWSFFWVALDVLIDYLVIQWALTSVLPYNLIFPLFFGSKAIGITIQSYCCLYKPVNSMLLQSFLIASLAAFWVIVMLELKPVPQIVLAVLLTKGLFGNFLALGRIKLAQNSEIKLV